MNEYIAKPPLRIYRAEAEQRVPALLEKAIADGRITTGKGHNVPAAFLVHCEGSVHVCLMGDRKVDDEWWSVILAPDHNSDDFEAEVRAMEGSSDTVLPSCIAFCAQMGGQLKIASTEHWFIDLPENPADAG